MIIRQINKEEEYEILTMLVSFLESGCYSNCIALKIHANMGHPSLLGGQTITHAHSSAPMITSMPFLSHKKMRSI